MHQAWERAMQLDTGILPHNIEACRTEYRKYIQEIRKNEKDTVNWRCHKLEGQLAEDYVKDQRQGHKQSAISCMQKNYDRCGHK
jgi:hypothetical protein